MIDTVYDALYDCAKIPFLAPEGLNCSVTVLSYDLSEHFDLTQAESIDWLTILKENDGVLSDSRMDPFISGSLELFKGVITKAWLDKK